MAHALEIEPNNFKKGDRVQHLDTGKFATVAEDQNKELFVQIIWDEKPADAESYMAEAFRIAPWHGINALDYGVQTAGWTAVGTVADEGLVLADTMSDKDAVAVLTDRLNRLNADIPKVAKRLAEENAAFAEDPDPLTERIIEINAGKVTRMRLEAEALAVALKKF